MNKNNLKQKKLIIGTVVVLVGIGFIYKSNSTKSKNQVRQDIAEKPVTRTTMAGKITNGSTPVVTTNRSITSEKDAPSANVQIVTSSRGNNLLEMPQLEKALATYKDLNQVIIKSPDQKKAFKNLFTQLNIDDAKKYLMSPESDKTETVTMSHVTAVDFLSAAILNNPSYAVAAIFEIVKDNQIESKNLPIAVRQLMAEDKAALMYNTLAQSKELAAQVGAAALSPATKVIHNNVLNEYKLNLMASQVEVAEYKGK
jgi:hypothetical protein